MAPLHSKKKGPKIITHAFSLHILIFVIYTRHPFSTLVCFSLIYFPGSFFILIAQAEGGWVSIFTTTPMIIAWRQRSEEKRTRRYSSQKTKDLEKPSRNAPLITTLAQEINFFTESRVTAFRVNYRSTKIPKITCLCVFGGDFTICHKNISPWKKHHCKLQLYG